MSPIAAEPDPGTDRDGDVCPGGPQASADARPGSGAVAQFASEHGQRLLDFAFLLTGGRSAQSEDLVQTVLVRLVSRGLDGIDNPSAYAHRAIVNEHRSRGRHTRTHDRTAPLLAVPDSTAATTSGGHDGSGTGRTDDRLTVLRALTTLSDRERAAIVLRYYDDLPDADIADLLGCSRPTVRSIIHRAVPKLRAQLGDTYLRPDTGGLS